MGSRPKGGWKGESMEERRQAENREKVCAGKEAAEKRQEEEVCLQETVAAAEQQLLQAREAIEKRQSEMIAAKRELREHTEHGAMDLWSADGFEALVELNQSLLPITDMAADCEELARKIRRLEKVPVAVTTKRSDIS